MDDRLTACAELCCGKVLCDVGTDHGYLPCYMIEKGLCTKAYACDIAPGPLSSAREHISRRGLEDKISPILSDGLENVEKNDITDVVIAGMGGELIADIISRCSWLKEGINLVLQPMTKSDTLRQWLYDNGFSVKKEKACIKGRFVYSVMQVRYEKPDYPLTGEYLHYGFVKSDTPAGKRYLRNRSEKLKKIGSGLMSGGTGNSLAAELLELSKLHENE